MTLNSLTSTCRYCQYYKLEGRRGGVCHMLGVPVEGRWKTCTSAIPAFAPSWDFEEMMLKKSVWSDASLSQGRGRSPFLLR